MDHNRARVFVLVHIVVFIILIAVSLFARQSLDTSDALFGLLSAVTESLLAGQMLSAEVGIATIPQRAVDAIRMRGSSV